jgi:tRNA A58 N-methylase Trm61
MYAAIAVKNMMDEVDPDSPFIVYLKPIVEQIIRLVNDMQEGDTQQRVLDVVSEMVDVMGDRVAPAAPEIYHMLVMLWQQSASQDRNLTKKGVGTYFVYLCNNWTLMYNDLQ